MDLGKTVLEGKSDTVRVSICITQVIEVVDSFNREAPDLRKIVLDVFDDKQIETLS